MPYRTPGSDGPSPDADRGTAPDGPQDAPPLDSPPLTKGSAGGGAASRRSLATWQTGAGELATGLLFLAVGGGMVWMADDFGPEARRLPFVVGIPLVTLAVINLGIVVTHIIHDRKGAGAAAARVDDRPSARQADSSARTQRDEEAAEPAADDADGLSLGWTLLALLGLVVTFYFTGLVLTAVLFTAVFMRLAGKASWWKIMTIVVVLLGAIFVFTNVLEVRVYEGWLIEEGLLPEFFTF